MPLVAQVTTAILSRAPSVRAGPWEWVQKGLSIIYDNVLLSGRRDEVIARWTELAARSERAGAIRGDTQPPSTTVTSCGFDFDVTDPDDRKWRLTTAWTSKVRQWLETTYRRDNDQHRLVLAGLAQWAINASLLPLGLIRSTIHGIPDAREEEYLRCLLKADQWRRLRTVPTQHLPEDATVVVTDGSTQGAGVVIDARAYAIEWTHKRVMERQQECEWDAAAFGIDIASKRTARGTSILLVADNVGLLAGLLSGNPSAAHATQVLLRIHRTLKGPLWCSHVASSLNPADEPSRSSTGVRPTKWPHPRELEWRLRAVLAPWSNPRS